jgi:hypothetical protein
VFLKLVPFQKKRKLYTSTVPLEQTAESNIFLKYKWMSDDLVWSFLLGTFHTLQNTYENHSICMHINNSSTTERIYDISYGEILLKFVNAFQFWLKFGKRNIFYMKTNMCSGNLSITHYVFIENVQNKNCKAIEHTFYAHYFFYVSLMAFKIIKTEVLCYVYIS